MQSSLKRQTESLHRLRAEEQEVQVEFIIDGENVGELLDPNAQNNPNLQTIERGRKLKLPAWQACQLSNWGAVQILRPEFLSPTVFEDLRADPSNVSVSNKSSYFWEVGMRLSTHMSTDNEVRSIQQGLRSAFQQRWADLIDRSRPCLRVGQAINGGITAERGFAQKLSIREEAWFQQARQAAEESDDWRRLGQSRKRTRE
uniref:Uncharacterized protein n=1 Tax=Chromera velia CCMP2878 TaxID=1169474 RepID=A0A0G4HZQ2_9ALVE|mmetsp:Transcript_55744/g.109129  ORF Transcript_55744/g.109129 Transcript_55744/m.109129 type:complete len:201 (+) Transcript_55744:262-864(+)|eukprot:Cvel_9758.t1-p1 / transcript=Cvel_9758.t1 / gene=Cvel_9758 / organism=Chromera_velia_CCMP2878 / gene_product=hypothetical protein / transcript_product=hypothetical protein / location=Cvel_scaffold571:45842-48272(+) / protein_length=200 / sequence_SO=supercontig / SO=protein_coding / is_pseudo=false